MKQSRRTDPPPCRSKGADSHLKASIIIPVFNKVEYTEKCVNGVIENTIDTCYEVIVVDNASTDGTRDFLKRLRGEVKVITNRTNLGFAKACNQGARVAHGRYLVFLNNDTVPEKFWLRAMVEAIEKAPQVGIVGSKLLYPDGTVQHAGVAFHGRTGSIFHIYKGFDGDHPAVNYGRDYHAVTGACLLIPRGLFWNVGGFYEGFIAGYEDVDLCLRVKKEGYGVVYAPKSRLIHFEEVTRREFPSHGIADGQLLMKRNAFPDDAEQKAEEDGFAVKYLEDGRVAYVPLRLSSPEKGTRRGRPKKNGANKKRENPSRKKSAKVPRARGRPKIAIVRGPNLNKWEMQNCEPLCERFDITAYATTTHAFDTHDLKMPIVHLPASPKNPAQMQGLEDHLGDKHIIYTADITWSFSLQAVKAKERYGNRVVCLEWENIPFAYEDYETVRAIKGGVIDKADHFVAVTRRAKAALMLEGVPEERIDVIPMGVDVNRFKPEAETREIDRRELWFEENELVVLFLGRLVWEKGIYDLVHAAKMLLIDSSVHELPVKFLIVGKGPELTGVRDRIIRIGVSDRFRFVMEYGYHKIHKLYNLADIFVLPSISTRDWQEQFGMVLVEAMACGKPVLSTLSGSIPEVVGEAGVLVQPNDPLSLFGELKGLLLDRERRDNLGRKGRKRAVEEFNSEKAANKIAALFDRVLAGHATTNGPQAVHDQALNLWNQGKREQGFQKLYEAFQEDQQNRGLLETLVKMADDLNRAEIGERCLKEYLRLHPANIETLLLLADNLVSQGKFEEAQQEIDKVRIFDPGNEQIQYLIDQIGRV